MATILVVDDRPDNRELLVELLGCSGHELQQAGDGAEALAMTIRDHPDLVIADILMPRMDGYEFVRRLRADPKVGATPVIFFTAIYDQDEARVLARKFGVTHLLVKPIEPVKMLRTVAEALGMGRGADPSLRPARSTPTTSAWSTTPWPIRSASSRTQDRSPEGVDRPGDFAGPGANPGRMLGRCCRAGREMIGAHHAILGMLEEDGKTFGHVLTEGLDDAACARLGFPSPGEGLLGRVVGGRDARAGGGRGRRGTAAGDHPGASSGRLVPRRARGHGRTTLRSARLRRQAGGGRFDREDEGLAESLASQLAIAFEDARRKAEIERHARRLERYAERLAILRRIDQAVLLTHRPREVASAALHHLRQLIDCWSIGVWVIDWEGRTVEKLAEVGAGESFLPRVDEIAARGAGCRGRRGDPRGARLRRRGRREPGRAIPGRPDPPAGGAPIVRPAADGLRGPGDRDARPGLGPHGLIRRGAARDRPSGGRPTGDRHPAGDAVQPGAFGARADAHPVAGIAEGPGGGPPPHRSRVARRDRPVAHRGAGSTCNGR